MPNVWVGVTLRNTLSTVSVARLLGVAVASVSKWIDAGQIKAGRTPGGHRRVETKDLVAFLQRQKLPIPSELVTSSPRVLIVDDEVSITELIAREIKARHPGFEVFEAQDGFSAGEIIASSKPDVVILDLRMPGMDGFETCRRIKSGKRTKETVVIAITAYHSEEAERRILEHGARICLTKPLEIAALIAEVESALSEQISAGRMQRISPQPSMSKADLSKANLLQT